MSGTRRGYEVEIAEDRVVTFVELTPTEMQRVFELAGKSGSYATQLEGLRMSVRKIDGKAMTYNDLAASKWDQFFSMKETLILSEAWNSVHMPGEAETAAGKRMRAVSGL